MGSSALNRADLSGEHLRSTSFSASSLNLLRGKDRPAKTSRSPRSLIPVTIVRSSGETCHNRGSSIRTGGGLRRWSPQIEVVERQLARCPVFHPAGLLAYQLDFSHDGATLEETDRGSRAGPTVGSKRLGLMVILVFGGWCVG